MGPVISGIFLLFTHDSRDALVHKEGLFAFLKFNLLKIIEAKKPYFPPPREVEVRAPSDDFKTFSTTNPTYRRVPTQNPIYDAVHDEDMPVYTSNRLA